MPAYHEIMTTDLSTLATAADRWDGMAKEFHKQEVAYKRDVYGISAGETWTGLSADAAGKRFDSTLSEFRYAQVEARAIASLLRDAHTHFVDLHGKLESVRKDAVAAGMEVSELGVVSYDTAKLSQSVRMAMVHDPDYQQSVSEAVSSWQHSIDQLVKDVNEADKGVDTAFKAVVIDSDISDGSLSGFNGRAQGDIEKYEADAAADARTKTDGWVSDGSVTTTGPNAGFTTGGTKYGKEGSVKAFVDLGHVTAQGTLTNGNMKLSGIADGYAGARATANYGFTGKGVVGRAEASAGARGLVEGRAEYGPFGVYGRADGFAGAEGAVGGKVTKDDVSVGASAFAGAKGGVAGGTEVAGIGFGGTAEGWAGPGAEAKWGFTKEDGKFTLGGKVGASPVLGGSLGFEVTVDPGKVAHAAGEAADAVGDAAGAVGHAAGSLKDTVGGWL